MRFLKPYTSLFLLLGLLSCNSKEVYRYEANDSCTNLTLHVAKLFANEEIYLRLNDELIFHAKQTDSINSYPLIRKFCIPDLQRFDLSLKTRIAEKIYIDTVIAGVKHNWGYSLNVSLPHPFNWQEYYKDGVPVTKWGYLTIDSSIRFVSLVSDSIYKNTVSCGLSNE